MATILLIDDDEFENIVLTRLMANHVKYGFRVDYAKSLEEALNFLKTESYDRIYLDDVLAPNVDATVSVERIRAHLNGASLIIISNNIEREHLRDTSILDVSAIVSKNDLTEYVYQSAA